MKVPVWTRQDLTEDFWDRDPEGFPLYGFQNGINKEILARKNLHNFEWHGDPYIAIGTTTLTAKLNFEFLTKTHDCKNKKYYYPIPWVPHHNDFELDDLIHIEPFHLKQMRRGNCKILIINHMEGWDHNNFFKILIDFIIQKYHLNYSSFVILSGNMDKTSYGVPTVYYNWWEHHHAWTNETDSYGREGQWHMTRTERKNRFICLNRRAHWHRIVLGTLLYPHRDKGILTLHKTTDNSDDLYNKNMKQLAMMLESQDTGDKPEDLSRWIDNNEYIGKELPQDIMMQIAEMEPLLPIQLDEEFDCNMDNPTMDPHVGKFYDSFLHVVTETYLDNGQTFFSEKIFKPIIFHQPFILIGAYRDLEALRSLGYKTFDGIIDESYDTIKAPGDRLMAAYKEIVRIINLSDEEIAELYLKCQDILFHNYWHWVYRQNMLPVKLKNDLWSKLHV